MTHCSKNSILTGSQEKNSPLPFINLALPVMDEPELLPRLLDCLSAQTYRKFRLFVCVNQPDSWWLDPVKRKACLNNRACLDLLSKWDGCETHIIDRSSQGHGWTGKRHGVGFARKAVMDLVNAMAGPDELMVSLDADSVFSADFLGSVARNFSKNPCTVALALPYYHPIGSDPAANRAMLRYEIYMRHYFLNLHRIGSPYAFTALGSAMALPVWAYRAIGGMTPKLSGEDFYFLQKLRKFGQVLVYNKEVVYPEGRFSDRVFFGTGPAMIRGAAGDWSSYPVYPVALFDDILESYLLISLFYSGRLQTKISAFLSQVFNETDPFQPLRVNHRDLDHFTRAFHEKFDGLRILQYLKTTHDGHGSSDEGNLHDFLEREYPAEELKMLNVEWQTLSFSASPVGELEKIREFLFEKEMEARLTAIPR